MAFVTFITTCKNRLSHIQETMPLLVAEAANEEIVFVDYGCSQGSGDWVREHYPKVKVFLVNDDPGFCAARARNMGASVADTPWLFFIDGDIKVKPGFVKWIKKNAKKDSYYRASPSVNNLLDVETWGSCLCMRKDHKSIDGYDEAFRGWGGEDNDLYARLSLAGINQNFYPGSFVEAISHDDQLRLQEYALKEKSHHLLVNATYSAIKLTLMRSMHTNKFSNELGKQLEFSIRNKLMVNINSKIKYWTENTDSEPPYFKTSININHWAPDGYKLVQKCDFTFSIDEKPIEVDLDVAF